MTGTVTSHTGCARAGHDAAAIAGDRADANPKVVTISESGSSSSSSRTCGGRNDAPDPAVLASVLYLPPGRKQTNTPAASRRVALNREAQRKVRERQRMRVASLEQEVAELSSANSALRARVVELESFHAASTRHMQQRIEQLEAALRQSRETFQATSFRMMLNHGLASNVNAARMALAQIGSLRSLSHMVDALIQLRLTLETFVLNMDDQAQSMPSALFSFISLRYKLLDACTVLDRVRFIEICEHISCPPTGDYLPVAPAGFGARNDDAVTLFHDQSTGASAVESRMTPFVQALHGIPSLQGSPDSSAILNEICKLFWPPQSTSHTAGHACITDDAELIKEEFGHRAVLARLVVLFRRLQNLCQTPEERWRCTLAAEVGRLGNREYFDRLVQESMVGAEGGVGPHGFAPVA
ncbi:hypothetical protein HDU83_003732 [Entophlyctis luteolus]|nr:hypothetical protein HDU83_003732 [Entophlyctis luteolus]